jgi:hypothetical protein
MAVRKSSEYRRVATKEPFDLELDGRHEDGSPILVRFIDPQDHTNEDAFQLARKTDAEDQVRSMLSDDDWLLFWAEWRTRTTGELNDLLEDVMEYYGANRGERRSSRR